MKYDRKEWYPKVSEALKTYCSASEAARELGMNYKTLKKIAEEIGVWETNQSGKGITKVESSRKFPIEDIIYNNKHLNYQSNKLRIRLIKEEIKEHKCERCNNTHWIDNLIPLELHHINGNKNDNHINNLSLLCPNCHALTDTYRGKNINNMLG